MQNNITKNINQKNEPSQDNKNNKSKFIDFQILIFICALFGLLVSIILWAYDLTKYSTVIGLITCIFTCLGFLPEIQ